MRRSISRLFASFLLVLCVPACARKADVVSQAVLLSDKGRYDEALGRLKTIVSDN